MLAATIGCDTRGINDRASLMHVLYGRLHHIEHREDVCTKGPFELLSCDVFDLFLGRLLGGIVDQDVEPPKFLHRFFNGLVAKLLVANVTCNEDCSLPFFRDRRLRVFGILMLLKIDDRYVCSFFCKQNRDGSSDPAIATRDERDLPLQLPCCGNGLILRLWLWIHRRFLAWRRLMLGWKSLLFI